uniref:Tc1-like transposase DDE domain-containing protein n=1 Tax=Paramormyrops kingsleyae TaxID=1676925 RepID=A0A3B3S4R3_9TELE
YFAIAFELSKKPKTKKKPGSAVCSLSSFYFFISNPVSTSLMIWGCMSGKGPGQMAVITSTVNAQVYIEILDNFLILSIESRLGDDEVIFQDDNASCHRAKSVKTFLQERHINSMTWPANSPDLNPIENLCCAIALLIQPSDSAFMDAMCNQ